MVLPSFPAARRRLGLFVVVAAVFWHLIVVLAPPRVPPPKDTEGRDFASYYYAAKVASQGGDPYQKEGLASLAQVEETREDVHPFFYPPPFLWTVSWVGLFELKQAFTVWFLMNELALLASCVALVRWWRPFSEQLVPVLAVLVAGMYGVAYSAELGQANFPVLMLMLAGLAVEKKRPSLGGVLVGCAAMLKMSPALLVVWWLIRGRWRAVGAAVFTAIATTVLTFPLLDPWHQLRFYTTVLPQFGSGNYNDLTIQIGMFANHSVPNLLHQAFPNPGNGLSAIARAGSSLFLMSGLATLGIAFYRRTEDPVKLAAQASTVLVLMLLAPVFTYEHHLVFALPAMVLSVVAVERGWLGRRWAVPIALAVVALAYEQPALRQFALKVVGEEHFRLFFLIQELKFVALTVVGAATFRLGATLRDDPSHPPPPRGVEG